MEEAKIRELLDSALSECEKLRKLSYQIIIGKNNQKIIINLEFPLGGFYHLLGLQYLKDVNELHNSSNTNKERLYLDVLTNKKDLKDKIIKSDCIDQIISRLYSILNLISILEENKEVYYSKSSYFKNWNHIDYDYAFHYEEEDYWFDFYFVKDSRKGFYSMVSTFSDEKPINSHANRPHSLLKKIKIDKELNTQMVIFEKK